MENAVVNPWDQVVRTRLTARQASETLSDHRQRMEDDVEHLQRALVLAMELRNSSAPILTLPDEVILQIFLAVRDLFYPLPRHVEKLPSSSWLVVAAVCRRLRRVAIASPGLHTCVSSRILPKRLVMRELDLSYPLDINLDVGAPHDNIASVTILNYFRLHGHRIRSCSMQVDTNSVESFIASHNRNWLPYARNIESLVISSATGIWYHGMSTIRFENTLPKLNRLELDCVRLDFTSAIFINLTELTLNHVRLNEVHHLQEASSHFHSLLGRMKHLERLALIDVWFETFLDDSDFDLPGSLRHLEYTSSTSLKALLYLAPSPSVRVRVVQNGTPSDSRNEMAHLTLILNAWLGRDNPATRVKLIVRDNTVASEARVAYYRNASGVEPDFEIVRYIDEDSRIAELLPRAGPLYNKVAHMEFDVDWDYPLFDRKRGSLSSLGDFPELSTLFITGPRPSVASPMSHLSNWPGRALAPILWRPYQLFTQDHDTMGDMSILLDWLTTRKSSGLSLRGLYLPVRLSAALDEVAVAAGSGTMDWRDVADEVHIIWY